VHSVQTASLFDVLADRTARTILGLVHGSPRSAQELREASNASLKTVYRRLEELQEADLVTGVPRTGADGNHYTAYVSTVDELEISIDLGEEAVEVAVEERDDVDRFIDVWTQLQE
jgi:DNA-binding transcriptional ArsR family regulator